MLVSYLIRLAVEKSGKDYLSFPQAALFDKVGIRTMRIETDPFGNFLGQGYDVGSGRDWVARQPVSSRRCLERRTSNELTFDCALARDGVSIRPQGNIRCARAAKAPRELAANQGPCD